MIVDNLLSYLLERVEGATGGGKHHKREVFNPRMVATVLAADSSHEGKQLFAELSHGQYMEEALEKALDEMVPSFALAYDKELAARLASQAS